MSAIKGKDTRPEMVIRRLVYSLGFRYRLHDTQLPGKPDLVFAGRRKVIFVHGCYWHRHDCPYGRVQPKTRLEFWERKFATNVQNDARVRLALEESGWRVLTIWECETRISDLNGLAGKIIAFLDGAC